MRLLKHFWHSLAYSSSNMVCFAYNISHHTIRYILLCWNCRNPKHVVIWLKLRAKLLVWHFLNVLGTFSHIQCFKIWLFALKLGAQHYLVYIIMLKWWKFKTIIICLKLRAKWRVWGFLSINGNFSHKVVQSWLVFDKVGTQQYLIYIIVLK